MFRVIKTVNFIGFFFLLLSPSLYEQWSQRLSSCCVKKKKKGGFNRCSCIHFSFLPWRLLQRFLKEEPLKLLGGFDQLPSWMCLKLFWVAFSQPGSLPRVQQLLQMPAVFSHLSDVQQLPKQLWEPLKKKHTPPCMWGGQRRSRMQKLENHKRQKENKGGAWGRGLGSAISWFLSLYVGWGGIRSGGLALLVMGPLHWGGGLFHQLGISLPVVAYLPSFLYIHLFGRERGGVNPPPWVSLVG